jgi:hypothetical protein
VRFYNHGIGRYGAPTFPRAYSKQFFRPLVVAIIDDQQCVKAACIDEYPFHLRLGA